MTLRELLEKVSRFQEVFVSYDGSSANGRAGYILDTTQDDWLDSEIIEIQASNIDREPTLLVDVKLQ